MFPNQEQQMPQDPQMGGMPISAGDQPVSEEQMEELRNLAEEVNARFAKLKSIIFATKNKSETLKKEVLGEVFEKMAMAGINLEDQSSVAEYINRIRETNPEIADQFEYAMDTLMGDEMPMDEQKGLEEPVEMNNEMNNENIQQKVSGLAPSSIG